MIKSLWDGGEQSTVSGRTILRKYSKTNTVLLLFPFNILDIIKINHPMSQAQRIQSQDFSGSINFQALQTARNKLSSTNRKTNCLLVLVVLVAFVTLYMFLKYDGLSKVVTSRTEQFQAQAQERKVENLRRQAQNSRRRRANLQILSRPTNAPAEQPREQPREEPKKEEPLSSKEERRKQIKEENVVIPLKEWSAPGWGKPRNRGYENQGHLPDKKHRDTPYSVHYPTVGMPIPQSHYNFTKVPDSQLSDFDQQILNAIKPYQDTDCKLKRFGQANDGGYVLCQNLLDESVALLNIGVYGQDKFGCDLTKAYPMPNYQYSCTNPNFQASCDNGGINYFGKNICTHENTQKSGATIFYTLENVFKSRKLIHRPIIFKLNQFEDKVLRNFAIEYFEYVDQVIIDFHYQSATDMWGQLDIARSMTLEMIPVNVHSNNGFCFSDPEKSKRKIPSGDIQVTFVNKRKVKKYSEKRSFEENSQNADNFPNKPKCPITQ